MLQPGKSPVTEEPAILIIAETRQSEAMSVKVCSKGDAKLTPPLRLRFLIIGGGLAGVTSAIALVKKGHDATVLETQTTFSEVIWYPS